MAKAKEFREMSTDQLGFSLQETEQQLFKLRFQATTEKLDQPSQLRKLRREVARIKTIQRERELREQATATNTATATKTATTAAKTKSKS